MGPRWRLLVIILVYLLYLFLGATIFSAIEHPIERDMIKDLEEERSKFLKENSCVQGTNNMISLLTFIALIPARNSFEVNSIWSSRENLITWIKQPQLQSNRNKLFIAKSVSESALDQYNEEQGKGFICWRFINDPVRKIAKDGNLDARF